MGSYFTKEVFSAIAIALTFFAFVPYIFEILKNQVKPHVFSWVIWGATTFVVFLAQLEGQGGVGAWPIGVSGAITIFIAILAFMKRADLIITSSDWAFFIAALSSLPFWYFTSDPLWAVVILTTVDTLGFGPTVRKAWREPHSESLMFFMLFASRNILVIFALETYSITTVLFPAVVATACVSLIVMILSRRIMMK